MATTQVPPAEELLVDEAPEKQEVLPKSNAEVAEAETPGDNGHGAEESNSANGVVSPKCTNGTAAVLRIVDTGAAVAENKKDKVKEDRPQEEMNGSDHGHGATGPDGTKTEPKPASQEKQKTEERTLMPGLKKHRIPNSKLKSSSGTATGFEKYQGHHNGVNLTRIKSSDDYEEQLRVDKSEAKLVSGRKAGQGWERSGIRFAPLNLPLRRRLQTMMVLFHTLCIAIFVSFFFFMCAVPLFWPLLIPYMIYCMLSNASTSGTLSSRSEFLRSSRVWSLFASYFPARLHRSQELPATRKYIFGYHPHGIISHGAFTAFATEALGFKQLFPGITNTLLTLDSNFRIPIYRDYALAMGLASVSKESCENILSKGGPNNEGMGRAITIVVGGARESLDAQPHRMRLVLKRRKGFVKMAIRTGADLVPVLGFGENDLYDQFQADSHPTIHKIQLLVKKILGFTIPLFHARGVFNYDVGLMPYRRPLNVVVGKPIQVVQEDRPSQESIDRVHEEYVTELERMWELWKDEFASERNEELQILE